MLQLERLKQLLKYLPDTGQFYWKESRGCVKAGARAGVINKDYNTIKIDHKRYGAHQLAIFYTSGHWPDRDVDHINGIKSDNRLVNLRLAYRWQNAANAKLNKSNLLGIKNITKLKDTGKYQVIIKNKSYGCYRTPEEAIQVANKTRQELFGEFANAG